MQDVICLGINYFDHAKESESVAGKGVKAPDTFPIYFSKRVDEAVAPGGDILSHSDIGRRPRLRGGAGRHRSARRAYNVSEADALEYVFGYTILNDVSARTIQNQHKQWYRGKSLDGFTPMGPWIVTPEEFDVREPWTASRAASTASCGRTAPPNSDDLSRRRMSSPSSAAA